MAKYFVTSEPGIYRAGEGFYHPGSLLEMPDDENPPRGVKPLDESAQQSIVRANKERLRVWTEAGMKLSPARIKELESVPPIVGNPVEQAKAKKEEGQTLKQVAASAGLDLDSKLPSKPKRDRSL